MRHVNQAELSKNAEIDLKKSYISIDSPMGRALIGHRVNDEIVVKAPEGEKQYYIVAISYDQL